MSATAIDVHEFVNELCDEVRRLDLMHLDTRSERMHIAAEAGDVDELRRLVRVLRNETLREISYTVEDIESFDSARADMLRRQALFFGGAHA
jgi:hypothetical protein